MPSSSAKSPPPIEGIGQSLSSFQRLRSLLKPEKSDLLAIVAFAVAIGLLQLATPIAVQAIVNTITFGGQMQALIVISMLLLLALTFAATLYCIQSLAVEHLQQRVFIRLIADLGARLPMVKIEAYHTGHDPELVNRIFDIVTIQKSAPKLLIDALGTCLTVVVGLSILAAYHPLLLVFDIFLILSIIMIFLLPLKKGQSTAIDESSAKYEIAAWLEEIVRCPYTFKNGGAQQWIFDKTDSITKSWLQRRKLHFRVLFNQIISVQFLYILSSVVLLGLGGWLVIQGSLSLGQLIAAEIIVSGIVYSVSKSGNYLETWYDLMAATYKVSQLLEVNTQRAGGDQPLATNDTGSAITFINVSWAGARGKEIYPKLDFAIKPGEKIAIMSNCESERSSMIDLLWRLRDPASGTIQLDGVDIRDLEVHSLRERVAIVSQVEVVRGTLRDNVSLHRSFVSRDDIRRAITTAGLDDVVASLPGRLDTVMHPYGKTLSEDELCRLMLARAIAGDPTVVVIDDVFDRSSQDVQNIIFNSLLKKETPFTVIIATDQAKVIEACDRMLQLESVSIASTST
ncbi:MAG: ATP-binding cassette domain-containing protein [Verrucomicrobiales bacterium]|nr:ATP-binding cassette domain-containing protein [Verrucomicrobiales bacterium]